MKYLISDHTPMDDYQWIIKQAYYTIESDEEYIHGMWPHLDTCECFTKVEKLKNDML